MSTLGSGNAGPIRVQFTGAAGEYFRIWIVNLALTVVTLGIYSAWAKVRKKRYFYGHTLVDGEGFEYRGNPVAILKGRIVAVILLAIYSGAGYLHPALQIMLTAVVALALPWLVVRSFAFNAHNSLYRNVRFRFVGIYRDALAVIVGYGILALLTAGILYPLWKAKTTRFAWRHHAFGLTRFEMPDITGALYWIYVKAIGVFMLTALAALVVAVSAGVTFWRQGAAGGVALSILVGFMMIYAVYLPLFAYVRARTTNLVMNNVSLGPVRFESRQRARELIGLYLVNVIAIVATLGLAVPWAVIRTMRYRASRLALVSAGSLDRFAAAESAEVGAAGGEVVEMFDIDIGL